MFAFCIFCLLSRVSCTVPESLITGGNNLLAIMSKFSEVCLGPVVNILTIFSSANILKKLQHQKVSAVRY